MSKETTTQKAFRLWSENAERVDWAIKAGVNATEAVNECLRDHLKPYLEKAREKKARELKQVLAAPIP